MSDAASASSVSSAESISSKKNLPNQPAYPGPVEDFAAISIEQCRGWLRNYRFPYDWPAEEVVAHCLLGRMNCGRRRPYCTRSDFNRCQELLRYPVGELKQLLDSHGFVAKKPNKTEIVMRILRAERHEHKRAKKANERRLKALREPEIHKGPTDVYSTDEDKEDDGDDTSSDGSFGWTEEEGRYIEVPITESGNSEEEEVEVGEDEENQKNEDDDDNEEDSEEGEELNTSRRPNPRTSRPTTARKAPVSTTRPLKRARTPDDEADYEIDPPSPERMRRASYSSAATSRSDSDGEEVDHEFAEDPLASLFEETSTGNHKRKRDEDVISVSDGEERSPKRIHTASSPQSSSASTIFQSQIAKQTRCDRLKSKSPRKARSSESSHAPVGHSMARKKPKAGEEVTTASGVTYTAVADGIARLKPVSEQVTSSGVAFIPLAEGRARLALVGATPASNTTNVESSNRNARSTDAAVEEPGKDRIEEQGYDGEDEADTKQRDEQDENEELEEGEYQDSSRSHPQSPVQSPEEAASLLTPGTKSKAHATKEPFNPDDSAGTAINSLKRKRAEKLADSGSDSDEPLIIKRQKIRPARKSTPNDGPSTSPLPTSQAPATAQSSNITLSQILQQQSHNMIIDGVDTRVLFENKKVPTSILNAMLRIMMGCAEESDVADVHQCRKNLPGYRAYLGGRMRAAPDEDNDWLTAQEAYEVREMETLLVSIGDD